ncbi:putative glucosamine-phosphate N-acetyltransferase [Helianthus anomalus]
MESNTTASDEQRYQVRRLEITDKNKGFMELLQQLTVCDSVTDGSIPKKDLKNLNHTVMIMLYV